MRPTTSPLEHLTAFAIVFATGFLKASSFVAYMENVRRRTAGVVVGSMTGAIIGALVSGAAGASAGVALGEIVEALFKTPATKGQRR
jgi:hypothetical protein